MNPSQEKENSLYGLIAEFSSPEKLLEAAKKTYREGYRKIDAYSPFPIHGLDEAIGMKGNRLPLLVLAGGIIGCLGGFFMQYFASVVDYPLNVGGKPLNSWPAFIPITFETTVLCAALTAVFGMFALNGLPMPYHPIFNAKRFQLASRDKFFLCVETKDSLFDSVATRVFLKSLQADDVSEVEK